METSSLCAGRPGATRQPSWGGGGKAPASLSPRPAGQGSRATGFVYQKIFLGCTVVSPCYLGCFGTDPRIWRKEALRSPHPQSSSGPAAAWQAACIICCPCHHPSPQGQRSFGGACRLLEELRDDSWRAGMGVTSKTQKDQKQMEGPGGCAAHLSLPAASSRSYLG